MHALGQRCKKVADACRQVALFGNPLAVNAVTFCLGRLAAILIGLLHHVTFSPF